MLGQELQKIRPAISQFVIKSLVEANFYFSNAAFPNWKRKNRVSLAFILYYHLQLALRLSC